VNPLFVMAIAMLAGWGLYSACRPRAVFVVRISGGVTRAASGTVTRGFLREIGDACTRHGVRRGSIRGVAEGRRIHLRFSPGIPGPCRQQIRNVWAVLGWSAGGPGPGRPRRMA
jgi:hypothetical protein